MKVLDCFDHLFVINLRTEIHRMSRTHRELTLHNIPYERVEGFASNRHASSVTNGVLGCALSHLYAVQEAQKRNYKSALIAEDDLALRR